MSSPQSSVSKASSTIGQHEKFNLTVHLAHAYDNPFDPDEIDVVGEFTSPAGKVVRVPGFWWRPFQRSLDEHHNEMLRPAGDGAFKIRFAWGEVGQYRYRVMAKDATGLAEVGAGEFTVTPSRRQGQIRVSERAPRYFEHESGDPYFPIGENLVGPGTAGTYDYDRWMAKLASHGCNYIRLWLCGEWNKLGLEHRRVFRGDGMGLGRYNLQSAWRIDYIFELAERLGFAILMCIDTFQNFDAVGKPGRRADTAWFRNAYFTGEGGPCERPIDFFTNEEARRLYQRRLRYFVARWGYSPAMLAWEFWNEVDQVTGYDS
ncbi:MAG: DUF5060 domain-containing protein, partial [Armatimonadetes bacterium]|nr:DUF5060 domain-containing protein [Armatimonadota bacterium]